MARLDNPFSLFEADDDEVDPVAILARVEAKKVSDSNAAPEQEPQLLEKKGDAGGRAERGRGDGRGGRGRGRGAGRAGGESLGQYGDGYSRGFGGDHDGQGGRGGRGGRGGHGRGRGRRYYEYRGAGNGSGDQYGANRNQVQDRGGSEIVEGGEVEEPQGRGYYGNRRDRNFENSMFGDKNQGSGWEARSYYGGDGRRYGGRNGWYERSENQNEPLPKEEGDESKTLTDGNDADSGSARDVSEIAAAPKDSENEVPKDADDEKANNEPTAEDVSEKKNAEDDTMTLEEYEKLLFEKRKALGALKTEERKVDVDVDKSFGGMTLIEKKKDEGIFIQLKSDKDKLKKAALEKEEKARKAMSINEFLKPGEGETYRGPSYARERAARIWSERHAREDEERRHDAAITEEWADAPAAPSGYGGRGRGRGRGQRGGFRGSNGERSFSRREHDDAFRGRVPNGESDKEFLDKEFPVLGGAVKA